MLYSDPTWMDVAQLLAAKLEAKKLGLSVDRHRSSMLAGEIMLKCVYRFAGQEHCGRVTRQVPDTFLPPGSFTPTIPTTNITELMYFVEQAVFGYVEAFLAKETDTDLSVRTRLTYHKEDLASLALYAQTYYQNHGSTLRGMKVRLGVIVLTQLPGGPHKRHFHSPIDIKPDLPLDQLVEQEDIVEVEQKADAVSRATEGSRYRFGEFGFI